MTRPTEHAKMRFAYVAKAGAAAATHFDKVPITEEKNALGHHSLAVAFAHLARGLEDLSDGLRATYMLLKEVKRMIAQQNRPGR